MILKKIFQKNNSQNATHKNDSQNETHKNVHKVRLTKMFHIKDTQSETQ